MLLKRIYQKPPGWEAKRNVRRTEGGPRGQHAGELIDPSKPEGELLNPPPIAHVEIRHTGTHAEQNFSTSLVEAAVADGWMTLGRGKLTVHGKPEDLVYTIKRGPGHYCCHCGERLPDAAAFVAPKVTGGMQHVAAVHAGEKSPDEGNPAGYCRLNHYECVLDAKQHEKFNARAQRRV